MIEIPEEVKSLARWLHKSSAENNCGVGDHISHALMDAKALGYDMGVEDAIMVLIARADIANMLANDNVTPDIHTAVRDAFQDAVTAIRALKGDPRNLIRSDKPINDTTDSSLINSIKKTRCDENDDLIEKFRNDVMVGGLITKSMVQELLKKHSDCTDLSRIHSELIEARSTISRLVEEIKRLRWLIGLKGDGSKLDKMTEDIIKGYALFYRSTPEEAGSAKKTAYDLIVRALLAEREAAKRHGYERGRAEGLEEAARVASEFNGAKHTAHDIATNVFPKQSYMGDAIAAAVRTLKENPNA